MEKAKDRAKRNLTKRKNPDWDNMDRGYRYLTLDMKLPHDLAIALMGNVVEESLGNYKAIQRNGGGRGLIQWDGKPTPSGRYSQWGSIWASVAKPANVYDSKTDTMKNYWGPWRGLKGDLVRLKFISAPLKLKAQIYAESYLRPGKPRIEDRLLSAMQLDSIYNPKIKNISVRKRGGLLRFLQEGGKNGSPSSWLKNIGNFFKSDSGKELLDLGKGLFSGISDYRKTSNGIDGAIEQEKVSAENLYLKSLEQAETQRKQALLYKDFSPNYHEDVLINNNSAAVKGHEGWEEYSSTISDAYRKKLQALKLAEQQARDAKGNALSGLFGNFVLKGLGVVGNMIGSKTSIPTTPTSGLSNNNTVYTSNATGISDSVDNWKKLMQV